MIWEIYAYWNITELHGVFNAIAMLTNSSDYISLVASLIVFAIFVVAIASLGGNMDLMQAWRWFIVSIILYSVMIVPKTNVALIDRTGTQPAIVVSNVPLSLAIFGHVTSKIGDWLTTSYETTLTVISPTYMTNGVNFSGNGLMFGHKIINEAQDMEPEKVQTKMNLMAFMEKCVLPEIDTGAISVAQLYESNDIWSEMANVNPSLYVTLYDTNGTPDGTPTSCRAAYTDITTQINNEVNYVSNRIGGKLFPETTGASATAGLDLAGMAFQNAAVNSYSYFGGVSDTAASLFRQRMVANSFNRFQNMNSQDMFAITQAEALAQQQYGIMAKLAESTMPKLRNVIEVVIYAVFPVVLILMIIAGSKGFMAIKSYVIALLWIQLWAPLYAVMNYLITSYRQAEWLAEHNPSDFVSLQKTMLIQAGSQSDLNIAGMLAVSIPVIAFAIVKGGEMAMVSFAQGATQPMNQAASRASYDSATGNISLGNTQMGNKSFETTSGFKYDMQPSVNMAGAQVTDSSGYSKYYAGNGDQFVSNQFAKNDTPQSNFSVANSQVQAYENQLADKQAVTQKASMEAALNSGMVAQKLDQAGTGFDISRLNGSDYSLGNKESAIKGFEASQSAVRDLAQLEGVTDEQAAKVNAYFQTGVQADAKLSALFTNGWENEFGIKGEVGLATKMQKILTDKYSNINKEDIAEGIKFQNELAENKELRSQLGVTANAEDSIRAETSKQANLNEKVETAKTDEKSVQETLKNAKENREEARLELGALIGVNNLTPEAAKFIAQAGQEEINTLSAAINKGDKNQIAISQGKLRIMQDEFTANMGNVAQKLDSNPVPEGASPTITGASTGGQIDLDKARLQQEQTYQQGQRNVQATDTANQARTGYEQTAQQIEDRKTGYQQAIDGRQENIMSDYKFEKDSMQFIKEDLQPEPKEIKEMPTNIVDAAATNVSEALNLRPGKDSNPNRENDVGYGTANTAYQLAKAEPIGQRTGEEVETILRGDGVYKEGVLGGDKINIGQLREMYNNAEITKAELQRFTKESDDLDSPTLNKNSDLNRFINSLPDQPTEMTVQNKVTPDDVPQVPGVSPQQANTNTPPNESPQNVQMNRTSSEVAEILTNAGAYNDGYLNDYVDTGKVRDMVLSGELSKGEVSNFAQNYDSQGYDSDMVKNQLNIMLNNLPSEQSANQSAEANSVGNNQPPVNQENRNGNDIPTSSENNNPDSKNPPPRR